MRTTNISQSTNTARAVNAAPSAHTEKSSDKGKPPKAFYMYLDSFYQLEPLSDAQLGRLIRALGRYANGAEVSDLSDDLTLNVLFRSMSLQIDRDFEKYRDICARRSQAGKAGAAALHGKQKSLANASIGCQEEDKEEDKEENKNENEEEEENEYEALCADFHPISSDFIAETKSVVRYLNKYSKVRFSADQLIIDSTVKRRLREGCTAEQLKTAVSHADIPLLEKKYGARSLPFFLFGNHFPEYVQGAQPSES